VAGGLGIAPLIALAEEAVAQGRAVTLLYGARTEARLMPISLVPQEVEVVVATDDGTRGHHGPVTELVPRYLAWAHQVFACGPREMYQALAQAMRREGLRRPAQVLLEEHMACGTGICYGCAVPTRRGMRLVCRDGPRMALWDVV
jgi:dihydroorotate dehydrogenase electron transfer subunit